MTTPSKPSADAAALASGNPQPDSERRSRWYLEDLGGGLGQLSALHEVSHSTVSEFQASDIVDLGVFGRTLIIDQKIQSCGKDERVYHESLVHPALTIVNNPRKVFIGGGGEGATAREVLRHPSVNHLDMVDLDEKVVKWCAKLLPEYSAGAFDSPRMHTYYEDAKAFLEKSPHTYDVIIMDLCDPTDTGACYFLYALEFYTFLATKLNPGGAIVTQSGPASRLGCRDVFTRVHATMKRAFLGDEETRDRWTEMLGRPHVAGYRSFVRSFCDEWGYNMVTFGAVEDPVEFRVEEIDAELEARGIEGQLEYYDGLTHRGMFHMEKDVRKLMEEEKEIITEDNPAFIYNEAS